VKLLYMLVFCFCFFASAADDKLDAAVFGEIKARNIGSATMSGRTTDFAGTAKKLYIATASGGLWVSEDGGINVAPLFDDHTQAIGCVTVDPNDPETIWLGTGEINTRNSTSIGDGVYKSSDGGKTWAHMGLADSERIGEIVVHPDNSDVVFVAALGHLWSANEERGLYKTSDGGKTWERILGDGVLAGCVDVDLDPQEPDTMYASMWQVRRYPYFFESGGPDSGMFKSTDGGKTWNEMRNGIPEGDLGRIDLEIAPSRPNRLYAMVECSKTGLYRSDDAGHSWELVNSAGGIVARPFYLSIIKVDPEDYNRVYNPSFSLSVSEDGGKSFSGGMFGSGVHPDWQALWIDPENTDHLIAGTDGGMYVSHDRTKNWRFVGTLPVSQFYHVTADEAIPYNVYGGLQDNGSWMAPSAAPGGITNAHWKNVGGGDGFHVAADRTDPRFVYWTIQGGRISRFDKITNEQKDIRPYPEVQMDRDRYNWNAGFAQSPSGGTIYYGSQYLYRSHDRGDSWERISDDLTTNDPEKLRQEESGGITTDVTAAENHCSIFTIAESPKDKNLVWVGTDDGNLQLTQDGGKTWTNVVANVPDLPKATWVSGIEASNFDVATAYVTFDGHRTGDRKPYVYKTGDYGKTWTSLATDELNSYCHVIRQDYVNPNMLFLGTEMGLFASLDEGKQWLHFTGGIPDKVAVKDMVFQKREHDLVVATHGRGIYVIDDISPLRGLNAEIVAEKAALLPSRPSRADAAGNPFGFGGSGTYVAANPPAGLTITYYLKKRHIFGKLSVDIFNEAGEKVATLPGGKRRGINRVNWSMRLKPPRVAQQPGLLFGAMMGPLVPEGTYTIKLNKGKQVYESTVELLPSRLNEHSAEDRKLQNDTVMSLYRSQGELAFVIDCVADLKDQCDAAKKDLKKGKLLKELEARSQSLDELLKEMANTESKGLFSGSPRLRDDVVDLYGAVSGYYGRPTTNQLAQKKVLEERIADVDTRFQAQTDLSKLNNMLTKAKKEPIKVKTREQWEAGQSKPKKKAMPDRKFRKYWRNLPFQVL